MNDDQWKGVINFLNEKFDEHGLFRKAWSAQTEANLPLIKKENSLRAATEHMLLDKERAVVIVGASPRLKEDVEKLKALDENFVLVCANSAVKYLLDHGIRPDYVISIDADDVIAKRDLDFDSTGLTLITSNASSHDVIKAWKGKILWTPYYGIDKELRPKVRRLLGKVTPMGGNTFTSAVSIAYDIWDARIFIFVANEMCYDKQYYAHKKSKWERKNVHHFPIKDVSGRERYTNIPLFQYKIWLEKFVTLVENCTVIDTSFGIFGTDCETITHMELEKAIPYVKDAFMMVKDAETDWHQRERIKYNVAYSSGTYWPQGWKRWKSIFKETDMKQYETVLDVGCGIGQGVAMCRNAGIEAYGIDIADTLKNYWKQANITDFCQISSADKIPFEDNKFDFVVCLDVLEHIPEEGIDDVLKEMLRVGNGDFLVDICIVPAMNKMVDGSEPHCLVRPVKWWMDKLDEIGFKNLSLRVTRSQHNMIVGASKYDDHFMPCNDLHVQLGRGMPPGKYQPQVSCSH